MEMTHREIGIGESDRELVILDYFSGIDLGGWIGNTESTIRMRIRDKDWEFE